MRKVKKYLEVKGMYITLCVYVPNLHTCETL